MKLNTNTITLRGITDYMVRDLQEGTTEESFYVQNHKNFKDIINQLNIQKDFEIFKKSGSYAFPVESKNFIIFLLRSYKNEFVPIRCKNRTNLDDEFAVEVYEEMINLFRLINTDSSTLQRVAANLNDILDYPVRKQRVIFSKLQNRFSRKLRGYDVLDPLAQAEWLRSLDEEAEKLLFKYKRLYLYMLRIRSDEIDEQSEACAKKSSYEESKAAEIDFDITEEFYERMNSDPVLRVLDKERNSILGASCIL